jgi:urease accessory protein
VSTASRVGRDGALSVHVERRGARSTLVGSRFTLPLQVLAPVALDDAACVVGVLNPTGGLVGGDRLTVEVRVGEGAHACLTTPSATRVYRTTGPIAEQRVRLVLGPRAVCEWVPDHTIPSAGAALRQSLAAELGPGATLIAVDAFAAGRVARGEAWRFAALDSTLAVGDAGGPLLYDRFVLDGAPRWAGLGLAEAHPYWATIAVLGDHGLDELVTALSAGLGPRCGAVAGVARLARRGLLIRCLAADAPAFVEMQQTIWRLARHCLLGLPPLALRKL